MMRAQNKKTIKNINTILHIWRMVLMFFMVFLFWALIKIGFSTSALTKSISDGIFKVAWQIASTIPMVPVPGLGMQSVSSIDKAKTQIQRSNPYQKKVNYEAQNIMDRFNNSRAGQALWLDRPEFREEDVTQTNSLAGAWWIGFWRDLKTKQIEEEKPIPVGRDTRMRQAIARWVAKDPAGAKTILWANAIPATPSVNEIMKLRDTANDETMPQWVPFRKAIDGIMRSRISGDAVTPWSLKEIVGKNQWAETIQQEYR